MSKWIAKCKVKKILNKILYLIKLRIKNNTILKSISFYKLGKKFYDDPIFLIARDKSTIETNSKYKRTDVINRILSSRTKPTYYLEIGVRNPEDNFSLIKSSYKFSVDPGLEAEINKADFKFTSDEFFEKLLEGKILSPKMMFDVIFIDGLHLANQVERDIDNSLKFIKEDGFIILHDVNPPTEWHARENYMFFNSPARGAWNGTVWKSFLNKRFDNKLKSCCIDADWGIGIISKNHNIGNPIERLNYFFEYNDFDKNRKKYLNLISFDEFFGLIEP